MIFDAAVYISPQCQAYNQSANESMTALLGIHRLDIYVAANVQSQLMYTLAS